MVNSVNLVLNVIKIPLEIKKKEPRVKKCAKKVKKYAQNHLTTNKHIKISHKVIYFLVQFLKRMVRCVKRSLSSEFWPSKILRHTKKQNLNLIEGKQKLIESEIERQVP